MERNSTLWKKYLMMISVISLAVVAFAFPSQSQTKLLLGSSTIGSTYYTFGTGWAKVMNEKVKDINITVEVTGGSYVNIQLIQDKKMELGLTLSSLAYEGWEGAGWAKGVKYDRMRSMFSTFRNYLHLVTLENSGIKRLTDLNGKTVITGAPGSSSELDGRRVLKLFGITPKKITPLPTPQGVDSMKDGTGNAFFSTVGIPAPWIRDLETTHKPILVGLSVEEMKKILQEYPYWSEGMIPAGTYKYVTENIRLIAFNNIFVCDKDLNENVVYTLTKATFDHHADLSKIHPIMKEIRLEGIKESPVPLHSGAARYFKEKGISIPDKILPR